MAIEIIIISQMCKRSSVILKQAFAPYPPLIYTVFLHLLIKQWLCSSPLSTHHNFALKGHQSNLLPFPGSQQEYTVAMPGTLCHLSQENESSKMLLSNAFYELCSALQWLALLRMLYLDYWYLSSGLLLKAIETKSVSKRGQPTWSYFKAFHMHKNERTDLLEDQCRKLSRSQ